MEEVRAAMSGSYAQSRSRSTPCVGCGATTRLIYVQGMCYPCFKTLWARRQSKPIDHTTEALVRLTVDVVCEYFDVAERTITATGRGGTDVCDARRCLCYLLVEDLGLSSFAAARTLKRDHSTVLHNVAAMRRLIDSRKRWAVTIQHLREETARLRQGALRGVPRLQREADCG